MYNRSTRFPMAREDGRLRPRSMQPAAVATMSSAQVTGASVAQRRGTGGLLLFVTRPACLATLVALLGPTGCGRLMGTCTVMHNAVAVKSDRTWCKFARERWGALARLYDDSTDTDKHGTGGAGDGDGTDTVGVAGDDTSRSWYHYYRHRCVRQWRDLVA